MLAINTRTSPATKMGLEHVNASASSSSSSIASPPQDDGDCTADLDDSSDSSSEEEGGIFFGTHTDAESRFLAKLSSKSIPSSPPPPRHTRRQSRLVSMIRRDSTEFNRRKTMAYALPELEEEEKERSSDDKIHDRYQQEISPLQTSPSAFRHDLTSSSEASRNPLLNAFASMHLAPSTTEKQSGEDSEDSNTDSDVSSDSGHSDSDKENMEVPVSDMAEQAEEQHVNLLGLDVTRGMRDPTVDDEITEGIALDMGGMKLSDFADEDEDEDEELGERSISYDSSEDESGGPLDSPTMHLAPLPRSGSGDLERVLTGSPSRTSSKSTASSPIVSDKTEDPSSLKESLTTLSDNEELDDLPVDRAAPTLLQPILFSSTQISAPFGQDDPASESPEKLPFESGIAPATSDLQDLASPTRTPTILPSATPLIARTPRQFGPLPTTATPSQIRGEIAPLAERSSKVLKSKTVVPAAEPMVPLKERSRTLAVRGKLDSIFSGKVSTMGPPQRPVSASSTASSTSSGSARPPSRMGMQPPSKPVSKAPTLKITSSLSRPPPSRSIPMSAPSKTASTAPTFNRTPALSSSTSCRPVTISVSTAPIRSALAPRSLVTHPAKQAHSRPVEAKAQRLAGSSIPPSGSFSKSISISAPPSQVNPLKRPLSQSMALQPTHARQGILTGSTGPRPALGLPSRLVRDPFHPRGAPVFHVGIGSGDMIASRTAARSPLRQPAQRVTGTPTGPKTIRLGTPSRHEGTPRTIRAKPSFQMLSQPVDRPIQDVSTVSPSKSSGPPASATRNATETNSAAPGSSDGGQRGSSADFEDVSMMLPQPPSSSPPEDKIASPESSALEEEPKPKAAKGKSVKIHDEGRPKRAVKPPGSRLAPPVAPYMSGKELKTTTDRNTMRNQVYLCAIDRQIVRVPGPRPPSPTSKIRTTADRDEEEKKKSREHRAKRRARDSGASTEAESPDRPVIQRVEQTRGPGDDEDWKTPARPHKKAKLREEKNVKWDRGLVIIHDDGTAVKPPSSAEVDEPPKGCVRQAAIVELDKNGNINESARPKMDIKRSKIVVTAVFYEGEEPVPAVQEAPPASSSGSKKKK